MNYINKKVAGVWIDHEKAQVIRTTDKSNQGQYNVSEKIVNKHHKDHGSSEKTHNNKTAQELHKYYEEITNHIQDYDSILIFGPGKAQEELKNFMHSNKHFSSKEIVVKSGERFTENEMIAFVRNNFSTPHN
jgi:stalled ribosome rescue protein Dom34